VSEAALDRIYLGSRPSVSPDGQQFVFEWCDNVWRAPVKGGMAEPLQVGTAKNIWPVIAPDGRRAVFQSDRDGGWKLFEVGLDGGGTRQVSFHSEGARPFGWTADGAAILAVVTRDAAGSFSGRVALLPSAGRGPETLLFDSTADEPSLSPDGRRLLFTVEGGDLYRQRMTGSNASQIWLYEIPEKRFTCLVRRETESRTPLWTPDGEGFYYVSGEGGCMNVRHRLVKGGKETPVTFFKEDSVIHPSLSQDGRTLVFRRLFDFYRMDPTRPEVAPERIMLHAAAPAPRPAYRRRYYNACWNNDEPGCVTFCDDGLQIAFTTGGDLWVMDTVLRDPKLIHGDTRTHERDCVFAPDGRALYYLSDHGDGVALRKAERADASAYWWENAAFNKTVLVEDAVHRRRLSVSPDGTRLAWIEPSGTIVVADTNGVGVTRCRRASGVDAYDWSPDSRWLVASIADDYSNYDIWLLSADGKGTDYNLSRHFSWDGHPCWSPDGKLVAFVGQRPNDQTDLFYVWLSRADEERNTFDKAVESAREAMRKSAGEDKKPSDKSKDKAETAPKPPVRIDFDDLHLRVRRIALPGVTPAQPFFSHDSRTLAFEATVKGQAGTYKVVLPDKLEPELLTRRRGRAVAWLAKDNRLLWMTDNLPAHFEKTFGFSAYQETGLRDYQELGFLMAWAKLRDWYYDAGFHGADWAAVREKYRLAARCAPSHSVFTRVMALLQGELNSSHLGFSASDGSKKEWDKTAGFQSWSVVTAHLGLRFDPAHAGQGWKIRDVIPEGPADQVTLGLSPGDCVLEVDGVAVSAATDPAAVLNGPENRRAELTVQSGTNAPRRVSLPATTFGAAREKLKTAAFEAARKRVRQASEGRLGYLNIQRMRWDDYFRFEQDIFAEGFGKEGLVIDVRDNTGGFVADRILGVLCGSVHSIAVARGAAPAYLSGYWGRPVWDKPLVVLCNQNTASNGEIFTHAIKTLKRGKVVGVPTSGGVIATSDVALLDLGTLRLPHRGWFLPDGTDMEMNGARPDVLVWNGPDDVAAGKDPQLDAAIDVLKREVEEEKKRERPVTLRYAR
jgi:tricorn protease